MRFILLAAICCVFLLPESSEARTWLVRQDGTGDCTTIQACINSASAGDSVLVGPGTYYEHLVITVPLSLVGELGSSQTTIDGGRTYLRCVTCSHPSGRVYVSGLKIAGGGVPDPYPNNWGGGILCTTAALEVRDCYILHNFGGGVGCRAGSSVTIIGCDIVDNYGEIGDPYDTPAAGVIGDHATGVVTGCDIRTGERGVWWQGGRLEAHDNVIYATPDQDSRYRFGSGFVVGSVDFAWIHHNLIRDVRDGIGVDYSAILIESNTIVNHEGYGIAIWRCSGAVSKNIVAQGVYDPGILCDGSAVFSCNDVWSQPAGEYDGTCSHESDIHADPMFCDVSTQNYYLHSSSPCANAPGCGQIGAFGIACGPTAVEETTWGRIKTTYR